LPEKGEKAWEVVEWKTRIARLADKRAKIITWLSLSLSLLYYYNQQRKKGEG